MRELSLNVMDIAQNAIAAEASLIGIRVEADPDAATLLIQVEDDGRGMTPEQARQIQSPFCTTRTTRPVGLGVPLFKMACEMTGGEFSIRTAPGAGAEVRALFHTGHIDMTPLGDICETILLLITCNPELDFIYRRVQGARHYLLDTRQLREVLGEEVPLSHPEVAAWLRGYLKEQEAALA